MAKITKKVLISIIGKEETFFARMYIDEGERVQDVLNDGRKFLPIEKHMQRRGGYDKDVWISAVIHKDTIAEVEER